MLSWQHVQSLSLSHAACCLPGLGLLLLVTLPWHRPWLRQHIVPRLHAAVQRQLPFVMWVNTSLSCTAMNFLTRASEGTVSVHFYIAVLSLSYMMGQKEAAAKLCAGLAVTTYLTGALKDLFCSPRPMHLCNREQKRQLQSTYGKGEQEHETSVEYGFPSLHTSAGLFFALVTVHTLIERGVIAPATTLQHCLAYLPAAVWGVWIGLTRIYLGVHSPMDLLLGALVGASVYGLWYVAGDDHLAWMTTPSWPHAAATAATHAAMLLQYPVPMHSTESFVHATTFLGAWGGVPIVHAAWPRATRMTDAAADAVAALLPPPVMQAWRQGSPVLQGARLFLGVALVLVTRVVAKALLTPLVRGALDLLPIRARLLLQPPQGYSSVDFSHLTARRVALVAAPRPRSKGHGPSDSDPSGGKCVAAAQEQLHDAGSPQLQPVNSECSHSGRIQPSNSVGTLEASHSAPGRAATPGEGTRGSKRTAHSEGKKQGQRAGVSSCGAAGPMPGCSCDPSNKPVAGEGASSILRKEIQLQPDGYPCDAGWIRRYLQYALMCCAVILYAHATRWTGPHQAQA